jgi:hypothetical protein
MGRWVYAERRCAECNEPLKDDGRADQRFCSDRCRQRASRSNRKHYATAALDMLDPGYWDRIKDAALIPGRDPALTASGISESLEGSLELVNYPGPRWKARAEQIRTRRPDVWTELTGSVILAAARPVPMGQCRWCLALMNARVYGEKINPDAATRRLLGNPCNKCDALIASVTAPPTTSGPGAPKSTTSPTRITTNHKPADCVVCTVADLATRKRRGIYADDPYLASIIASGQRTHTPTRATGRIDLYRADGRWQLRPASRR